MRAPFDIRWCPDGSEHDFELVGFVGPYMNESCVRCGVWSLCPAEGYPSPFDVIIDALERKGCDPRPAEGAR